MPAALPNVVNSDSCPVQWLDGQQVLQDQDVGWKAAFLSKIQAAGMRVPPGFVISPRYFQAFLQGLTLDLTLDLDSFQSPVSLPCPPALQLWQMAETLQQQMDTLPWPESWERSLRSAYQQLRENFPNSLYILRPSIAVLPGTVIPLQTTGLLESVLHPLGETEEPSLWFSFGKALRSLYRQCFQARSLLYWHYHRYPLGQLPLAVLVQPLLPALASGTIEITDHEVQITATWGMGLSLTQGDVVPDRYGVRRSDLSAPAVSQTGQKPWLYWHPDTPQTASLLLDFPEKILPPSFPSSPLTVQLRVQRILGEQPQSVLSPAQLTTLSEAALAVMAIVPQLHSLEWVLAPALPDSTLPDSAPPDSALPDPSALSIVWTQVNQQSPAIVPAVPDGNRNDGDSDRSGESTLRRDILQGQGVSRGMQVGRVYPLEALAIHPPLSALPPVILVGEQLTPDVFPWLERVSGLILAQGGATSHGAILARELQIPAVVGVGSANLHRLLSQPWVAVDGQRGIIQVLNECPPIVPRLPQLSSPNPSPNPSPSPKTVLTADLDGGVNPIARSIPASIVNPIASPIRIFATLNQRASLNALSQEPTDGIGLLRSEWFFLDLWEGQHPQRWINQGRQAELRQACRDRIQHCINVIQPRPLFYRSVDCRATELQSLDGQGTFPWDVGGAFAHCFDPRVLNLELEMLYQVDRCGSPLHFVLPMVRTVEEFICCRDRYHQFLQRQTLETPHSPQPPLSLWIMAEVPSILLQLPALAQAGVEGLIIGPGDLCHYLFGLNRERSGPGIYELHHPLVHETILKVLREAQHLKLPTLLCCHSDTLPPGYWEAYRQAGLWGITAELPHLKGLRQAIV